MSHHMAWYVSCNIILYYVIFHTMCYMWYVMSCHIISCHVSEVISYMLQCDYITVTAGARRLINGYYLFIDYLLFMSQLSCHIMLYHVPDFMLWHVMACAMCHVTHYIIHHAMCHICVRYNVWHIMCHISCITCHVLHVIYHIMCDIMYYLLCVTYVSHIILCHISHMWCISCITCYVSHVSHVMSHMSSHMCVTSFLTISHM